MHNQFNPVLYNWFVVSFGPIGAKMYYELCGTPEPVNLAELELEMLG